MIEREFEAAEGAETVGFSHGDFSLVVQALDKKVSTYGLQVVTEQIAQPEALFRPQILPLGFRPVRCSFSPRCENDRGCEAPRSISRE